MEDALTRDRHRPQYHFLPPDRWMNDPNGVIHWKGMYHLFYQYNPNGPFHGTIHWGHAASQDLVHWTHLPIALTPTPGSADEDGCWSGCAVDNDGVPTLLYSGNAAQQQLLCLATGSEDLVHWKKYAGNPVITAPPAGLDTVGFRDHCVWKEGDLWYQLIGSGIRDVGGAALLYRSRDLINWQYMHPLLVGDSSQHTPVWSGTMWECPQLLPLLQYPQSGSFALPARATSSPREEVYMREPKRSSDFASGNKYILLLSVSYTDQPQYTISLVGTYINYVFLPERQDMLDGGCFYAPQALIDEQGRRIMWGWLREGRSVEEQIAAGWSGVMSLPRLFSLRPDNVLNMQPAPELTILRGKQTRYTDLDLASSAPIMLTDVRGDALELIATFEPDDADSFGVLVSCSPDRREETRIVYNSQLKHIAIDRSKSSLNEAVEHFEQSTLCELTDSKHVTLHIYLDHSVIEVFVNEQACLSSRIYPTLAESMCMGLFASDGKARLASLEVWEMASLA